MSKNGQLPGKSSNAEVDPQDVGQDESGKTAGPQDQVGQKDDKKPGTAGMNGKGEHTGKQGAHKDGGKHPVMDKS